MARAWVGLTMVACVPCMAMLRSGETRNSYGNCQKTEKCYEYAVMSRKNLCQTSLPPALRHKVYFAVAGHCRYATAMRGHTLFTVPEPSDNSP